MVTVFCDCEGVVLFDVMQTGTTVNSNAHISRLNKMKNRFHRVRPDNNPREMLLQHY
jgi:hypothetical protein